MNSKISIIVPVYKTENFIKDCIDSIINQTYKNLEIILIDDGSPDNCPKICDTYSEKDSRIRVIHKKNGGLSSARNIGLENSTGDFVFFLDSDDIIQYNTIECMINQIKNNKDSIIISSYERFTSYYNIEDYCDNNNLEYTPKEYFYEILKFKKGTYAWGCLIPRYFFDNVTFIEKRYFEDLATMYKVFYKANKILFTPTRFYKYRKNTNSIVNTPNETKSLDYIKSAKEMSNFLKSNYDFNEKDINTLLLYVYRDAYVIFKNEEYLSMAKKLLRKSSLKNCSIKIKLKLYMIFSIKLTKLSVKFKKIITR